MPNELKVAVGTNSSNDFDVEQRTKEFADHVIKHSQLQTVGALVSGSSSEIPLQTAMVIKYKLEKNMVDQDNMVFRKDRLSYPRRQTVPENDNTPVIRMCSNGRHGGYTKLYKEDDDNTEMQFSEIAQGLVRYGVQHGPADTLNFKSFAPHFMQRNSHLSTKLSLDTFVASRAAEDAFQENDAVFAVHCPFWPPEAQEWITRKRPNGSPLKSTIKTVVRYGCDIVHVSHKSSSGENEWRFSFSKAEIIIIHSWTRAQRIVYRSLHILNKLIKAKMSGSVLCTYHFKTLMLWATEEREAEFWSENQLISSVYELLISLTTGLNKKVCLNYFIPSNNMMDHLTDPDLSAVIDSLNTLMQDRDRVSDVVYKSTKVEVLDSTTTYSIEAPMWLYASLLISEQLDYSYMHATQCFSKNFTTAVQSAIDFELAHIVRGLMCHQKAKRCVIYSDTETYLSKSEQHFESRAMSGDMRSTWPTVKSCSKTLADHMLYKWIMRRELRMSPDTSEARSESNPTEQQKNCADSYLEAVRYNDAGGKPDIKNLLYSRSMDDVDNKESTEHESTINKNAINVTLHINSIDIDNICHSDIKFYDKLPGISPTVNLSWFICRAYFANLRYATHYNGVDSTGLKDMLEACDNVINVYKESWWNQQFSECSLPVILSTEWTTIYDEHIQAMLGLYSLITFLFNETDRSRFVCLGVCSVQYAKYLKYRCLLDLANFLTKLRSTDPMRHDSIVNPLMSGIKIFETSILDDLARLRELRRLLNLEREPQIHEFFHVLLADLVSDIHLHCQTCEGAYRVCNGRAALTTVVILLFASIFIQQLTDQRSDHLLKDDSHSVMRAWSCWRSCWRSFWRACLRS